MKNKMVRFEMDLHNPPPLTAEQIAELDALDDRKVDFSDIPPLTPEFFKNAIRNPWFKPIKKSTTVRIDADILAWLRAPGKGYQSRMNEILRRAMFRSVIAERKAAEEQRKAARSAASERNTETAGVEAATLAR